MLHTCINPWCKQTFEITEGDMAMMKLFDVEPELPECPRCRHIYRAMFSPQLILHRRTSDLSGKPIISVYSKEKPFPVYSIEEWWSEGWDPMAYGKDIDFSLPFFPQFEALYMQVPKMANFNENCENCEYSCGAGSAKNAYYCMTVYRSQDMYYSEMVTGYNSDLVDCLRCQKSSQLYECVQCIDCHISSYLYRCFGTRDSYFCIDCKGCNDCLFSCNLRNKSFHVWNKPVSKEEFQKIKAEVIDGKWSTLQENLQKFSEVCRLAIWPNVLQINCENCTGDQLMNSANCVENYNCFSCFDSRYCWDLSPSTECTTWMDVTRGGIGELCYYSTHIGGGNYFIRFCSRCRLSSNLTYCTDCYSCKECFGCSGLKNKKFCIFNKEYPEETYMELVQKITDHMRHSGEWGKFFPISSTPFAYPESSAMTYMPLPKEEVLARGFQWADLPEIPQEEGAEPQALADAITDTSDDICKKSMTCEKTGRKFRILSQELSYYRRWNLPIPRHHPDVRMNGRRSMLNPYQLWDRSCAKCNQPISTSYSPERPEIVVCEECYLKEVY